MDLKEDQNSLNTRSIQVVAYYGTNISIMLVKYISSRISRLCWYDRQISGFGTNKRLVKVIIN